MSLPIISQAIAGRLNEAVEELETFMLEQEQIEIPAKEQLKNGLYTREITIPAGTLLTGRVWLEDYIDIMISGDIVVATADGVKRLTGYSVCDGKGGRKRAGYALQDTQWVTVHKTKAKTVVGLLEQLSTFSMAEFKVRSAQLDFKKQFSQIEGLIAQQSAAMHDFKSVPAAFEANIDVKPSAIHGLGLFSKQYFKCGDHIAPARIKGFRTEAGKYSNHSCFPNAKMQRVGNDIALVAICDIKPGDELVTNYNQTLQEATCLE